MRGFIIGKDCDENVKYLSEHLPLDKKCIYNVGVQRFNDVLRRADYQTCLWIRNTDEPWYVCRRLAELFYEVDTVYLLPVRGHMSKVEESLAVEFKLKIVTL